jgi:hypothetical protein
MRSLTVLSLLAASVGLAACGSSGSSTTNAGASSKYQRGLAFASCMRSHGVPNFPDPTSNGAAGMRVQVSPGGTKVNGVTVNGPAFQSAMQSCKSYLPNGGSPSGAVSAQRRQQALKFAQCMRTHGVPNFPDPQFHGGGVLIQGINPNDPAFQKAQQACGSLIGKAAAG